MQISVNSQLQNLNPDTSVHGLLQMMGHAGKRLAVECNGAIVPRSQHDTTFLQNGDTLEIVIAVGGG